MAGKTDMAASLQAANTESKSQVQFFSLFIFFIMAQLTVLRTLITTNLLTSTWVVMADYKLSHMYTFIYRTVGSSYSRYP